MRACCVIMSKRNSSDSSVLSDHHSRTMNPTKKPSVSPLITRDDLPEATPEWALVFVAKFNELNESIQYIGHNVDSALSRTKELESKVDNITEVQQGIVKENETLKNNLKDLCEKQHLVELELRKSNAVFKGISEEKFENCPSRIKTCLKDIPELSDVKIKTSYRLGSFVPGNTRDILVQFESEDAKHVIYGNKSKLPSSVTVRDDIPPDIYQKRKDLMPVFKLAKSMDTYRKQTRFHGTKLRIGRTLYTKDNLHQLPPDLSPAKSCTKEDEHSCTFFGRHNPLSNFYECDIIIEGQRYKTSEHYLQEQKAKLFGDKHLARKIKNANTAVDAKSLSYDIKNYDNQLWASSASDFLETALKNKFAQNEFCRQHLLNTKQKRLGEATKDMLWGTGIPLSSDNCLKHDMWSGRNLMGRTLEMIRHELSN